ncbi:hypothetical protein BKA60DRAFT_571050 [Fusarium oxysporum]|nr:hypothetical protein BKA60DRAFT_571050 [Fusarium oxysporum]
MAQSEDPSNSHDTNHDNKTTTMWGIILCVVVILVICIICFVHWLLRNNHMPRPLETQLPRFRTSSGLGKFAVESMPTVTYHHRIHSKQIHTQAQMTPYMFRKARKPKLESLQRYFTMPNLSNRSPNVTDRNARQADERTSPACSICTEDFIEGKNLRKLPCGHLFHPQCIDPWLIGRSRTCPLCRVDLTTLINLTKPQVVHSFGTRGRAYHSQAAR